MGFTYPDKFTCLNTFVMEVAQTCSDNGGLTVYGLSDTNFILEIKSTQKPIDTLQVTGTNLQHGLSWFISKLCYKTNVLGIRYPRVKTVLSFFL